MDNKRIKTIKDIVNEQANNEALWFEARHITEAYLQQELRRLHEAIEGKTSKECAIEIIKKSDNKHMHGSGMELPPRDV